MKIAVNKCYGGFGLSHEAVMRYAELKGIKVYPENGKHSALTGPTYWLEPPATRDEDAYNVLYDRDIPRDDPALIQTIEELGKTASDRLARLVVTEIPDGVGWTIEEYDGQEWIAEKHRTW